MRTTTGGSVELDERVFHELGGMPQPGAEYLAQGCLETEDTNGQSSPYSFELDVAAPIAELTRLTRRAVLEDLERLIAGAATAEVDYAVFSGVQIHTPDGERVWPADAYAVTGGERRTLPIT